MDPRFDDIIAEPENQIFHIAMYPDRIYHAQYLNATVSERYRYNVTEVRDKHDISAIKGEVYFDGRFISRFLRIEYRASRLTEASREHNRLIQDKLTGWLQIGDDKNMQASVTLHYCRWIDAYQVELWQTLETPSNCHHDIKVSAMMGLNNQISRVAKFDHILAEPKQLNRLHLAFSETGKDPFRGYRYDTVQWDNNYHNTYQAPNSSTPSAEINNVNESNYAIFFQQGWFLRRNQVKPVRYLNPLMDKGGHDNNIVDMRWILQRELGGRLIYFHEVTLPPNTIEGSHRHVGSEEVYHITESKGIVYMGDGDDPALNELPLQDVEIFKLGSRRCRVLQVEAGDTIFTKSGGIHGIRNDNGDTTLRFVAFAYHTR